MPPTVTITAPADGSSISTSQTLNIDVQATDDLVAKEITLALSGEINSTITKSAGSGKGYSERFTLTTPATITGDGSIQLAVIAKDSAGNLSSQANRTITLKDGTAPVAVSLTSPGTASLYKPGDAATATFTASDNMGVATTAARRQAQQAAVRRLPTIRRKQASASCLTSESMPTPPRMRRSA